MSCIALYCYMSYAGYTSFFFLLQTTEVLFQAAVHTRICEDEALNRSCLSPGPSPAGGQWCPAPPFEIGALPFHIWIPGCYIHPILYFKMWHPFWFLAPPAAKSWRRACLSHSMTISPLTRGIQMWSSHLPSKGQPYGAALNHSPQTKPTWPQ